MREIRRCGRTTKNNQLTGQIRTQHFRINFILETWQVNGIMKRHALKDRLELNDNHTQGENAKDLLTKKSTNIKINIKGLHKQNNETDAAYPFLITIASRGYFFIIFILVATSAALIQLHESNNKASFLENRFYLHVVSPTTAPTTSSQTSQGRVEKAGDLISVNNANKRRLFGEILKDAFLFARNPTEFRHQVMFLTKHDKDNYRGYTDEDFTDSPAEFVYSKEELALILRSLYTLLGFMNMPLWSGSPAYQHFIGTGSCLAKMKRPASEVALGLLHGMYVQSWHPDLLTDPKKECQRRRLLQSVIGSEMEQQLFYMTGVFGNGQPYSCLHLYRDMLLESHRNPNNQTIQEVIQSIPYHFLLCDDIEEFLGGDVAIANNWRRRQDHHFDLLQEVARLLGEPKLVSWIETSRQMTIALYNTSTDSPAFQAYGQIRPRSYESVYNRSIETFRSDANSVEVDRMKFIQDTSRKEWRMLSSYFKAGQSKNFHKSLKGTRVFCERYHNSKIQILTSPRGKTDLSEELRPPSPTLDDYMNLLEELRTKTLNECERKNKLTDHIPFPAIPPKSVVRSRFI